MCYTNILCLFIICSYAIGHWWFIVYTNYSSFRACKQAINLIIERGKSSQGPMDPNQLYDGQAVVEMSIPGNKVGLIIGKGGETIRQLQVSGCSAHYRFACHRLPSCHVTCGNSGAKKVSTISLKKYWLVTVVECHHQLSTTALSEPYCFQVTLLLLGCCSFPTVGDP